MMPVPALPVGQDLNDPAAERHWIDWSPFSYPFNLTRQPAASIPCGLTRAGLPVGLQIVGPRHRDDLVLQASYAYEQARPWNDKWPVKVPAFAVFPSNREFFRFSRFTLRLSLKTVSQIISLLANSRSCANREFCRSNREINAPNRELNGAAEDQKSTRRKPISPSAKMR
jgi:hypothetical protein